ncbi:hypothetical protein Tco_1138334 [Tanacetum coccineum]
MSYNSQFYDSEDFFPEGVEVHYLGIPRSVSNSESFMIDHKLGPFMRKFEWIDSPNPRIPRKGDRANIPQEPSTVDFYLEMRVTPNSDDMNDRTGMFTMHSDVFTSASCTCVSVLTSTNIDASTNPIQSGSQHVENTRPILYFNVATTSSPNGSANKNGGEHVGYTPINVFPTSYAIKVIDRMKNSLYGYYIDKRLVFPVVECLLKEDMSRVLVWGKFYDVLMVAYTSDGLSLIAMKISTSMMLDSYKNSMCLGSWCRTNDARFKKSGGNDADTKKFKSVLVKPNTIYHPKVNQLTKEVSPKIAPSFGKKKVSTTPKSSKKTCKTNTLTLGNGTFSPSNLFEALNVDNPFTEELDSGNIDSTSGMQEEGQSVTTIVENINMIE